MGSAWASARTVAVAGPAYPSRPAPRCGVAAADSGSTPVGTPTTTTTSMAATTDSPPTTPMGWDAVRRTTTPGHGTSGPTRRPGARRTTTIVSWPAPPTGIGASAPPAISIGTAFVAPGVAGASMSGRVPSSTGPTPSGPPGVRIGRTTPGVDGVRDGTTGGARTGDRVGPGTTVGAMAATGWSADRGPDRPGRMVHRGPPTRRERVEPSRPDGRLAPAARPR